jgi:DNA-binding winged helix-turn-helix (wHTH) protein/tetratricopeptide (TPR) repeat protein
MSEPRYTFGEFVFDAQRRVLERDGVIVALPNKASELLALLLREAGQTVSKERIYEAIWGEKIVEEGNLTQTVYVLRRTLSNGHPARTMIRTIPQVGYAFVEPVNVVVETAHPTPGRRIAAVAAAALLALLGYMAYVHVNSAASNNAEALLPTPALKAYELGRQAWNAPSRQSALRAREQFVRVVKIAPKSALGYAGLSDTYLLLWGQTKKKPERERYHKLAETYAQLALKVDPDSSEAHASNAQLTYYESRPGGQQEFERAIELNPRNALAHRWYGEYWMMNGHFEEAAQELGRSNAIQPLVPQDLFWLGVSHYYARHYDAAAQAFGEAVAAGGNDPQIRLYLALSYDAAGNTPSALRELARMEASKNPWPDIRAVRASILAMHGEREAALREIAPLMHSKKSLQLSPVSVAVTLARSGNVAEAEQWLNRHHKEPDETSIFPYLDPRLVGLHLRPLPPPAV